MIIEICVSDYPMFAYGPHAALCQYMQGNLMQSGSKTLVTTINIFLGAFWGNGHFLGEVPPKCPICSTVCSNINICCSCNVNADDDEIYVLRRCHIVDDERQQDGLSISLQCGRPNVE